VLRYLTAGESHGRALVVIVEGLPAGLTIAAEDVSAELARRRLGYGRGPRMRFEADEVTLLAGVRHGRTLGSPVAIEIANTEWPKWTEEMSPEPGRPSKVLTQPRPGHADLAGMQKYGFDDARDVLERASARETAARVAAGSLAKRLLAELGIEILSHIVALGEATLTTSWRPGPGDLARIDASPVRCGDPDAEAAMVAAVKAAAKVGDSLGGVAEVIAYGVPVGLGSHVHWDRKLDGLVAQALMSIQAVKAVEIGEGWEGAARRGSAAHDAIAYDPTGPGPGGFFRRTDRAGGIEGGISVGGPVWARVAMKPLATLNKPVLETVDVATKDSTVSFKERTDVTAVPAMGVVAESMMALVVANEALRKFGGDALAEVRRNRDGFVAALGETPSAVPPVAPPRLLLVGMMGAGKTTTGRLVAERLGWDYLDSDAQVQAETGRSVPEILERDGEAAFRRQEAHALRVALSGRAPVVVSVAGGAVLDPANRAALRGAGTVIWLRARPETLAGRVGGGEGRPLLGDDPPAALKRLEAVRRPFYAQVADHVVDVDELGAAQVAERVVGLLDADADADAEADAEEGPSP
jgi:chorismate synthase